MDEFPSNSQVLKKIEPQEEKKPEKLEKIVGGKVTTRKKSLGARFVETFFTGSSSVWGYVLHDILIPAAKDTISDVVSQGVERAVYGESRGGGRRSSTHRPSGSSGYVSYNRYSQQNRREEPVMSRRARATHDFKEILLDTRRDAEAVIDRMFELVQKYEQVTISDLYDLVGVTGTFADERYGWRDLRGARAHRVSGGYLLDLPQPEILE